MFGTSGRTIRRFESSLEIDTYMVTQKITPMPCNDNLRCGGILYLSVEGTSGVKFMMDTFEPRGFRARVGPVPFLALATLSQTGMSFVQQGIVVMGVFFATIYHLTLAQMGLVTTALSLGIMTSMVIMGAVVDRIGPRRLLFAGSVLMSLLALGLLIVSGFYTLLILLYGLGVALAIAPASGTKAVFTAFQDRPRGMVMGIRQTGVPLGALLAASLLPRLIKGVGFHTVFWMFGIELVVLGWAFSGVMNAWPHRSLNGSSVRLNKELIRAVWPPSLVAVLLVSGQYLLLGFSLTDLHRVHHVSLVWAGLILAASQLGGGVGRVLTGIISDRIGGRRSPVIVWCGAVAAVMSWVVAILPVHVPLLILGVIWFVFGMGAVGWNALTMTWAGESVPAQNSGLAMSSVGTSAFLGSAIFPPLFGALVDSTHQFGLGWGLLGGVLSLAAILAWVFGRRSANASKLA